MGKGNFFQDIITSIFNSSNSDALKKRMLKKAAKDLSKSKYHFYKYSSHEVDISFAKFAVPICFTNSIHYIIFTITFRKL